MSSGEHAAGAVAPGAAEKKPIGVGLIGCGGRGSYLARFTKKLKEMGEPVDIVSVCDIYRPRLEKAAESLSAKAYKDSADLLADPRVNAVIVATPDRVHVYKTLEAIRAGKDVYCEKPLTHWTQFEKLKELVGEARRTQAIVQVGAQWVSDPIWERAGEAIKKGSLGKVVHAQCGYFRNSDSGERGMRVDDPNAQPGPDLNWDAFQADAPSRAFTASRFFQWRMYMDYSGGPATDVYPHPLTRLVKALGVGLPKKVVAVGGDYFWGGGRDVPDTFDMLIEYPDKLTVAVLGTLANDTELDTVIRGSEGTMRFSNKPGISVTAQPEAQKKEFEIRDDHYELDHQRDFFDCVRSRKRPRADIELGYAVQVALIMGMRSFVENKVAHFDAANEEIRMS